MFRGELGALIGLQSVNATSERTFGGVVPGGVESQTVLENIPYAPKQSNKRS